jgi:hypothetical protein
MIPFKKFVTERYNVLYKKESEPDYSQLSVTDSQFGQAFRYLQVDDTVIEDAKKQIKALGLNDVAVKQIISLVLQHDKPENFFNAIKNKMSPDEFFGSGNIVDTVANKYDIDRELVINILNYQAATQPVTGKGEAIVMLFVEGARKGAEGDVDVNGVVYEIKGSDARLRGQKGFGTTTSAINTLKKGLTKLLTKAGIKAEVPSNFTIGKKDYGVINYYAPQLLATGKVTRADIIKLYADGFKELYQNAAAETLMSWLNRSITDDGTIVPGTGTGSFYINYFIFAIQYYASIETFNYIVTLNTTKKPVGKVTYLSKETITSGNEDNILAKIQPDGAPSITPGAGPQGAFFAIKSA